MKQRDKMLVSAALVLLFMASISGTNPTQGSTWDTGIRSSQASGAIDTTLTFQATGDNTAFPITLARGYMYNFSVASPDVGRYHVSVASNETTVTHVTGAIVSTYSDGILSMAGAPWWGNYDQWDDIGATSPYPDVNAGVILDPGENQSFLLYIDAAYPTSSIACTLLVIHAGTGTTTGGFRASWSTIPMTSPVMTIPRSPTASIQARSFPAGTSILAFGTAGNADLTRAVLNTTVYTNVSCRIVAWEEDLSGNFVRKTSTYSPGTFSDTFVPAFRNLKLDGSTFPALLIAGAPVQANWSFHNVTDTTVSFEQLPASTTQVTFLLGQDNVAYRIFELPATSYLDITCSGNPDATQAYWDVSMQIFTIGKSESAVATVNNAGMNESESFTFFASRLDGRFTDVSTMFKLDAFDPVSFWIAGHGSATPGVNRVLGTRLLGIVVHASHDMLASTNLTCDVRLTSRVIEPQLSTALVQVGAEYGKPFNGFEPFHVRTFDFTNFTQHRWEITSYNVSSFDNVSTLVCNDPSSNNRYPRGMNNALVSQEIDTSGVEGVVWLRFTLTLNARGIDDLLVYVQNTTTRTLLQSFSGNLATIEHQYDITAHAGGLVRIIFNMTSSSTQGQTGTGPRIDDVRVENGSSQLFFDGFEGNLGSWTEVDNTESNESFWYIDRQGNLFNQPRVDVVYPNIVGQMTGYPVNPFYFTGHASVTYGNNPFVQPGSTGYIVVFADNVLKMNFTASVARQAMTPINLVNGGSINSDQSYTRRTVIADTVIEETVLLPDFYPYCKIRLEQGTKLRVKLSMDGTDEKFVDATIHDVSGVSLNDQFDNFFGFFLINHTYDLVPANGQDVFIKFDALAHGLTMVVSIQQIKPLDEFPWFLLTTIILAATTALATAILIYNRRVITFPKTRRIKGI